jgi:hypothetical protein
MTEPRGRDVAEAALPVMTEAEMAQWWRDAGAQVSCHHGRYWTNNSRGFYQPVHWLACLKAHEAIRPTLWCWGYRTTLHAEAAGLANGYLPLYLLSDVGGYSFERLPAKRRTDLRKCRKQVQIVQLTDSAVLVQQGYEVVVSAELRIGRGAPPERQRYMASVDRFVRNSKRMVLAGFVNGKLAGYLSAYAAENAAYIETVFLATEYLPTAIGTGLVFDFVQMCRRSPKIERVVYGQHSAEDPNLTVFKEGMGFPVTEIPCRVWVAPGLASYLRRRYPYKYYRLTGVKPS